MRPTIQELEYFVAVADQGNFSKAARHLNFSQPPLTRHIQSLEAKIGTRLLDRNTHTVNLTPPGRLFLEDARNVLRLIDRATEAAKRAQEGEPARLRLAFVGALLDEQLVTLIRKFREKHPDCQLEMSDLAPADQWRALRAGELDGGFLGARPARTVRGIGLVPWKREPLILALPKDHPLVQIERLKRKHLENLPWVLVSRAAAPAFRQQFSEFCQRLKLSAKVVQESDRVPAILTMVAAGSGVSLVPEAARHLLPAGIAFHALPAPGLMLQQTFAYRVSEINGPLQDFLALWR